MKLARAASVQQGTGQDRKVDDLGSLDCKDCTRLAGTCRLVAVKRLCASMEAVGEGNPRSMVKHRNGERTRKASSSESPMRQDVVGDNREEPLDCGQRKGAFGDAPKADGRSEAEQREHRFGRPQRNN